VLVNLEVTPTGKGNLPVCGSVRQLVDRRRRRRRRKGGEGGGGGAGEGFQKLTIKLTIAYDR